MDRNSVNWTGAMPALPYSPRTCDHNEEKATR